MRKKSFLNIFKIFFYFFKCVIDHDFVNEAFIFIKINNNYNIKIIIKIINNNHHQIYILTIFSIFVVVVVVPWIQLYSVLIFYRNDLKVHKYSASLI